MNKDILSQIDQINELLPESEKLDDEILICECFCVEVRDIRETCAPDQNVSIEMLQKKFNLGGGCQDCLKKMNTWIYKIF
jgi:NAD(P)H-nitrite reductase large subunit